MDIKRESLVNNNVINGSEGAKAMPVIKHKQHIEAAADVCFNLARKAKDPTRTTTKTISKAAGNKKKELLEEGDLMIWETEKFGFNQRVSAEVTYLDEPFKIVSMMVNGALFHSFTHIREFIEISDGTMMICTFEYRAPFGPIGIIANKLFLEKQIREFIASRANALKVLAESGNSTNWKRPKDLFSGSEPI